VKRRTAWLLAGLLGGTLGLLHYLVRMDRYGNFAAPVFVDIPRGTSSLGVAAKLAQAGVIRHPLLYPLARLRRPGRGAQAGEYRFSEPATPAEVFARLAAGDVYLIEIRVPEGSTMFDIAATVERAGLGTAADFVKLARSPKLILDLAPTAPNLEGYLFPSTYRFRRNTPLSDVCRAMTTQFHRVWRELHTHSSTPDANAVVTLASMVEKESALASERAHIAGVYARRDRKGMKLDCDPTVIYAALLTGRWTGAIRRSDLASNARYNTYTHAGLPPGPIANPGRDALAAALAPAETTDLYFVAAPDASGAHIFSKDFDAHSKAVASYRRGQRKHH